jgi:alkylhydroperoxidase family enzyme
MRELAPEAFAVLAQVEAIALATGDPVARTAVAAVLSGGPEGDGPGYAFAQQIALDVASVTDEQRAEALQALGRSAFGFVQSVYVADLATRVRLALEQLFGEQPPPAAPAEGELWPAIEELMRCIARLSALDPVTTELVRLRGARAHDCRLCRSLRDTRALEAGGTEALYDAIDDYESSDLPERQKAALRIVDAMVWTPTAVPRTEHLTDAEVVEVVLDVMRNAGNKVAVALGADAARVTDGVELYTVDATGEPVYGLS